MHLELPLGFLVFSYCHLAKIYNVLLGTLGNVHYNSTYLGLNCNKPQYMTVITSIMAQGLRTHPGASTFTATRRVAVASPRHHSVIPDAG